MKFASPFNEILSFAFCDSDIRNNILQKPLNNQEYDGEE